MMQLFSPFPWMRRFASGFAFVAAVLVVMVPLAACGGSSTTTSSTTPTGTVNLTYWSWIPGMDKQVALFNQTHPQIHITLSNVGSGTVEYDKLFTAIKANNEPDLAQIEFQTLPQFETTSSLVELSQYGANSVKDQFPSWMWNEVMLSNGVYAIPQDGGPMALYYREDIFTKYNLPVPTTWAQFADDAAKLHAANPKSYITDFPPRNPGWFTGLMWQNGANLFSISGQSWKVTINSPQALQVASYWQDLFDKKLIKTDPDFTNSWYSDLQSGVLATWLSGAWGNGILKQNAPQSAGKWRVAPLPQWQAGQNVSSNWGGSTTVVFKSSKYPQQASTFAQWISANVQSAELEFSTGAYPASIAALSSPSVNSPQPYYGNQVINQVFSTSAQQVNVNFQWGPSMVQVYNDMGDNFANAVNGHGTFSDGLNAVQQSTITYIKAQGFSVSS
jgi:multiple sugar transport system substrate-binding protein